MAFHDPLDALELLAEFGYQAVGITVDHAWLNPYTSDFERQLERVRDGLARYQMRSVIETGARYLLDPRHKHLPTLLCDESTERQRRVEFLKRCIDIARECQSDCVSLWSGRAPENLNVQQCLDRLAKSLEPVISYADDAGVILGFEPEPGMFIDTMKSYRRLLEWIDAPSFQLTLDVGHLFCQGELPIVDFVERWAERIVNVHIEDMRAGIHEHLMFGEGDMHFPPIIRALHEIQYERGIYVELSRHSHEAPVAAQRAFQFLSPLIESAKNTKAQ